MKVSPSSSLSVSKETSVQKSPTPEALQVLAAVVVAVFDYRGRAMVGNAVCCCSASGEVSVGTSGMGSSARPRSIEGGETTVVARLGRGRCLSFSE
eukprot:7771760-Pyramimonas_sp.AAC.1